MPAQKMRQITRRLHAEHHEMALDSERVGFALAIPSGATPDFGTSGVKLQWTVRLSFLVIPPSPEGTPSAPPTQSGTPLGSAPSGDPRVPNGASGQKRASHGRSRSHAYGFEPAVPLTLPPPPPVPPSGAVHLMPVPPSADDPYPPAHLSYRAIPDLGYVPVLFSSAAPEAPPAPGPLQRTASGASHRHTPSASAQRGQNPFGGGSAVLVPAKVETVECAIPIKVYPGCVILAARLPPSSRSLPYRLAAQEYPVPPDDLGIRSVTISHCNSHTFLETTVKEGVSVPLNALNSAI